MNDLDQSNFNVVSFEKICRTCLSTNDLSYIMDVNLDDIHLKDILNDCASLQLENNDGLPKNICNSCIRRWYDTHNLLETSRYSENMLKEILNNSRGDEYNDANIVILQEVDETIIKEENCSDIKVQKENEKPNSEVYETVNKPKILLSVVANQVKKGTRTSRHPIKCAICSLTFHSVSDLKKHRFEVKHPKEKRFPCTQCGQSYDSISKLDEHILTHTGEKPIQCNVCGKQFRFQVNFKRHMILHSDKKPHNCRFCKKGFTRKQYLIDHERTHNGDRLVCKHCGKLFISMSTLYVHEKIHQAPNYDEFKIGDHFSCNLCDKTFQTIQKLKYHISLHAPKDFHCEKCTKTFVNKKRLQDHCRFVHKNVAYSCDLCDKVYKSKGGLTLHIKSHTGDNSFNCPICNTHFTYQHSLRQHVRLKTCIKKRLKKNSLTSLVT